MGTTRITINIDDDTLSLLENAAKEKRKYRAHLAGDIIRDSFIPSEIQDTSTDELLESRIILLESEILELKKDKAWYQGEISQLHQALPPPALPAPKKSLFWFLNRKE